MDENSLSYKTLRNASYNFTGFVLPILFSVFITPVVVHKLGVVDFGIYVLVNTISAFLTLVDLGLSTAMVKFISEYHAKGEWGNLRSLMNSANSLYLIIGFLGLAVFLILGKWFLPWFNISGFSVEHIFVVFLLAGMIFFLNAVNSVYTITPQALQRYDILNKINLTQSLFLNLSLLALVLLGYKLKAIMLANLVFVLFLTLAYRWYFYKLLPKLELGFSWVAGEIKKAYKFGILAAISSLSVNALAYIDRLIIPIFTGPAQLTYYTLPGNVALKTAGVTNSLASLLFPMASALEGKGETATLKNVYIRAFRNLTIIAAGISTAIVLFSYKILFFWLGEVFAQKGATILIILAVTYFSLSLFNPLHGFLLGLGKLKFLLYSSVGMAGLNLVLVLSLVPKFGIMGAAWAFLVSALPVAYIFYWVEKKFLFLEHRQKFYLFLYAKLAFTTAVYVLLVKYLVLPWVNSLVVILVVGPSAVLLYYLLYYIFGFAENEDVQLAKKFLYKFLRIKNI